MSGTAHEQIAKLRQRISALEALPGQKDPEILALIARLRQELADAEAAATAANATHEAAGVSDAELGQQIVHIRGRIAAIENLPAPRDPEIQALLTRLQQELAALERRYWSKAQPAAPPPPVPVPPVPMTAGATSRIATAPPLAGTPIPAAAQNAGVPAYKLFAPNSIQWLTFLGTPLLGAILMAVNYRRLGVKGKGLVTVGLALLFTTVVFIAVGMLPFEIPQGLNVVVPLLLAGLVGAYAKAKQGDAVTQHVACGGKLVSNGILALIALGGVAAVVGLVVGSIALVGPDAFALQRRASVRIGNDIVFYSAHSTRAQAENLGGFLKSQNYFTNTGAVVHLEGNTIWFAVLDGVWDNPAMVRGFESLGYAVAKNQNLFPLQVKIMDARATERRGFRINRVASGQDEIVLFDAASTASGRALAAKLKELRFFQGSGYTVAMSQRGDDKALCFFVGEGGWNDQNVAAFEDLVRQAAPAIGGLPITLRLAFQRFEDVKKEVVVSQ